MKTFKLIVRGKKQNDVELAIVESMRLIGRGMTSGHDRNDDGAFFFESEGEYDDEGEGE